MESRNILALYSTLSVVQISWMFAGSGPAYNMRFRRLRLSRQDNRHAYIACRSSFVSVVTVIRDYSSRKTITTETQDIGMQWNRNSSTGNRTHVFAGFSGDEVQIYDSGRLSRPIQRIQISLDVENSLSSMKWNPYVLNEFLLHIHASDKILRCNIEELSSDPFRMECMVSTGPFDIALKVMNVESNESQAGECGSYPIWAVINRCIVLCANRKYSEAEALYKEIQDSISANKLYKRTVLALGIFFYSKLSRAQEDAFQLIENLRKTQDDEDRHVTRESGRLSTAEDPVLVLARIEAERELPIV